MASRRSARGPSGAAAPPPPWLTTAPLPLIPLEPADELFRIHTSTRAPVFFGPGKRVPPLYRFDPASRRFGILYAGLSFEAALAETILRNPSIRSVRLSEITTRSVSRLRVDRSLRMVKMYDEGLSQLGLDSAISTGPYEPCGLWSDALWDHRDRPGGIAYRSRHDPAQICLAIFQRGMAFTAAPKEPLMSHRHEIQRILARYGKTIEDDTAP